MRALLVAALAAFPLAETARAQAAYDWVVQGGVEEGGAQAIGCLPGESEQIFTSLCVYVGCEAGQAPELGLGLQQVALPPETSVRIAVDGKGVADLILPVADGGPGGAVPLEGLEALVEALRTGQAAQVTIATAEGPRSYDLPLRGAGNAIDAALAACPSPGAELRPGEFIGQDIPGRTSEDPAGEALAENAAFCAGGVTSVDPGFLRQADIDGDGVNDVLIDYLALTCDGSRAFCGTGGCTREVWLGSPEGPYRLLVSDLIQDVELTAPGRIRLSFDGGYCGLSGAESCVYDYRVEDGQLRLLD